MSSLKSYKNHPDWLLWLLIKQNDQEALAAVFDRYAQAIFRFIYFKVSSQELAEDLASQVFLKIIEQLKNNSELKISSLKAYLYRIAKNLVIDHYRSKDKEALPLVYNVEEIIDEQLIFDPAKEYEINELEKILQQLKPDFREILTLRYIEDLSIKEIAKVLDKSSSAVRVTIHRALKELQKKNN